MQSAASRPPSPQRELQRDAMSVRTVTFGLESVDSSLYNICAQAGANTQAAAHALQDACKMKRIDLDVILDTRMFPDVSKHVQGHSGRHHLIIRGLCQNKNFPRWLKNAKHWIRRACQRKQRQVHKHEHTWPLNIALYCWSGKHCSVAGARIIEHILSLEGFSIDPAVHLSAETTGRMQYCKGMCEECQTPPPELQNVLRAAHDQWRNMGCV